MDRQEKNMNLGSSGIGRRLSRRSLMKGAGALAVASACLPQALSRRALAAEKPLKLGLQVHRTGIGAAYGRWYEQTSNAAVALINEKGGIAGRPVELVIEDDGTDPKRGSEVVEKLATQHNVDVIFGPLFSHVVIGAAPRAGELKIPLFVVSETTTMGSGDLNRYVFQPGITDVRAQVKAISGWVLNNLGKKATMIFPDYAFGYDHRDFFSEAAKASGGEIKALIPIPPTETSFTKYFPQIPADTEIIYHVMVGPGVLTFVKEMGEHFGTQHPQLFGFVDSIEAVDLATPGLEFLEGSHFWEAFPRYADGYPTPAVAEYRKRVGVNDAGASVDDPKEVSTYSHMFGCWETLFVIKQAIEKSGYQEPTAKDKAALIETLEGIETFEEGIEHPQGAKKFVGKLHQSFGQQFISKVENQKLKVVHTTKIEDGLYESKADYTAQPL
jgi:branched-chain amino acid transport system substrate-binding protein